MTKIFIPPGLSFQEIKQIIISIEQHNIIVENTQIGGSFNQFIDELTPKDTAVVYSLDFFPSLIELLTSISRLQERGITMQSIEEPWLNKPVDNTADFLEKLRSLAIKMHASRTKQGLIKARSSGKQLGRPVGSGKTRP